MVFHTIVSNSTMERRILMTEFTEINSSKSLTSYCRRTVHYEQN